MSYRKTILTIVAFGVLSIVIGRTANAIELLTNGNFETGTSAGWTITDQAGGSGSWFIDAPGTTSPASGIGTSPNPGGGLWYAVTDQTSPGAHALTQTFTTAGTETSVILSFEMFVQPPVLTHVNPAGLDYTANPNQFATVDILSFGSSPFDTGGGVLANYYQGLDTTAPPAPYITYNFDITALVGGGGLFTLRFAEVDNQSHLIHGLDNVSIQAENAPIPEPATVALLGIGLAGLAGVEVRRRRKKTKQ